MINLVDNTKLLLLDSDSFSLSVSQLGSQSVILLVSQSDSLSARQPVSQTAS